MTIAPRQLTLDVLPHPRVRQMQDAGDHVFLEGSLALKLDVPVRNDLNHGDRLMVTVADGDGTVLARAYAEVKSVELAPLEIKDIGIVGTERVHKAKLTDDSAAA
jgi:hypothetical protein